MRQKWSKRLVARLQLGLPLSLYQVRRAEKLYPASSKVREFQLMLPVATDNIFRGENTLVLSGLDICRRGLCRRHRILRLIRGRRLGRCLR